MGLEWVLVLRVARETAAAILPPASGTTIPFLRENSKIRPTSGEPTQAFTAANRNGAGLRVPISP